MVNGVVSAALCPELNAGAEECWMEIDGGRMRYLRTGPAQYPLLAKDARSGAPTPGSFAPAVGTGARSSRPLILLHGLLGYSFSWRFALPALAPYAAVYAPDMMGAGFSDRVPGIDYTMRGTARRVLRFIEGLGLSSSEFDLLGTSHGGAVGMFAAAECLRGKSRLRVRRLVLVAPVNPFSAHGKWMAPFFGSDLGAGLFRLSIARMNFLYPYWHARMFGDRSRIPPGTIEGYLAPMAKPDLFEHALSIVRSWTADLRDLEATLPELAGIPMFLMWGSKDSAVYASSAEPLRKYFPNSRLIVFPGVGHLPYEECPEEFNGALIEYLTSEKIAA